MKLLDRTRAVIALSVGLSVCAIAPWAGVAHADSTHVIAGDSKKAEREAKRAERAAARAAKKKERAEQRAARKQKAEGEELSFAKAKTGKGSKTEEKLDLGDDDPLEGL